MAGVLEFTIGLQVNEFLHNVGMSTEKLLSLEAIGEGLHRVFERVSAAIEQGTALEHLSRRSGETAGNLYKLQQGLEAAGVSAGELPTMLFMMQKALGGVSEMGESTADVFHKLGLNIADLKRQGPAEAFSAIMGRMGGLTQDSAAKASSMIFGRMGAGSAVQVSRSPEEFREAVAASARQADIFERMAGSAGRFHASMLGVKREVGGLFAGLAEGVLPALNSLGEKLGSINLTKFGLRIGDEITAAFEAVRLEKFGEYFKLTLQSATFDVANFFGRMLQDALGNKQGGGSFGSRLGHGLAGAAALLGAAPFELGSQMAGGAGGNPLAELAFSQLSKSFGWVANAANLSGL